MAINGGKKLSIWCCYGLILFLPISAWLVSVSGREWFTFGRDILLALLVLGLMTGNWRRGRLDSLEVVILFFVGYCLLSFFWREESLSQWLRGIRFVIEPLILFLLLRRNQLNLSIQPLLKTIVAVGALVALVGLTQFIWPQLLHFTFGTGLERGYIGTIQRVGGNITRIQSTLAGPNALGLYLIVVLLTMGSWWRLFSRPVVIGLTGLLIAGLLLTFSRSSLIGFGGAAIVGGAMYYWRQRSAILPVIGTAIVVLLIIVTTFLVAGGRFSHGNSSMMRLEQYHRIATEYPQIGLTGRGIGAAGLVSQDRLDNGNSRFTENTFLDMFEGLGLIGFIMYAGLWLTILWQSFRSVSPLAPAVFLAGFGLVLAGLLVNHYTGQAVIWLFWLLAALALSSKAESMEANG